MPPPVDLAPYGSHPPRGFARMMLALTRRLPPNWLGLRTSMPLRRMAIDWLGEEPVDTTVWNARVRLYPSRNSCEKNALFTPQMLDVIERGELADALDRRLAEAGGFTFVDIGANVGLYSLFVAARGGPLEGRTELFITPGFEFARVDALVTNFHLPRSTLLALVMAFAGVEETRRLYRLAVEERYRFYSFGDAMLLL